MSIASNVIEENNRLGTARTLMRQKLTANSIYYSNSDSVIQLVRRWNLIYADISFNTPSSGDIYPGAQVSVGATITDPSGKGSDSWSFEVPVFPSFSDYAWDYNTGEYDIVKYPSDISHTFEVVEVSYSEYYNLTKATSAASVVMAIPKVYSNGIDATNGIHIEIGLIQKKDSNQGWGDAIALVNSKSLSHYRDTKILELGAYPGKKGLKYSTSDHVVRDVNVTTGQLTLDSQMYYFDLYYDNGYVKATIRHGSTNDFTYEADISDKITFDTFYPAMMIYDAGGHIQWESVYIEPWTHEEE